MRNNNVNKWICFDFNILELLIHMVIRRVEDVHRQLAHDLLIILVQLKKKQEKMN